MKLIVFAALAMVSFAAAANTSIPVDTTQYSCQDLRTIVRRAGPSGRDINGTRVYSDMYGQLDCDGNGQASTLWVKDATGGNCPVGLYCAPKPSWQNN